MPIYHRYRAVRPDGAVFTHETYNREKNLVAIFTKYEAFERLPDGSYKPLRTYWELHRGYFPNPEMREWYLGYLNEDFEQMLQTSAKPRNLWRRLVKIEIVYAEYIGKVEG